jgi:hypothetical protein
MRAACVRCGVALEKCSVVEMRFLSCADTHSRAMLECPRCGHVEFVTGDGPVLQGLEMSPVFAGDGD